MQKRHLAALISASILTATLSGCAMFRSEPATPPVAPDMSSDTLPEAVETVIVDAGVGAIANCSRAQLQALLQAQTPEVAELLRHNMYFFGTDASELSPDALASLNALAGVLKASQGVSVQLDGHTDARGTHDYNLALGERRGNAVASYLQSQGAKATQMTVVSFGKEQPIAEGNDESAWAQNRRVQVAYSACDMTP
jgi:peptidoglycan-associated lipoprotein